MGKYFLWISLVLGCTGTPFGLFTTLSNQTAHFFFFDNSIILGVPIFRIFKASRVP